MEIKKQQYKLTTADNENIVVWKYYSSISAKDANIFLTHGTFSDQRVCLGIVQYFAELGYTCWVLEWRSHGSSAKTDKPYDIESIALFDIKCAFDFLLQDLKLNNIHCLTHSAGGIALTMFMIRNDLYTRYIASIVMFSCQAFGAANTLSNTIKIQTGKFFSSIAGVVPGSKIGLGVHDEKYHLMKQWYNWNLDKNFKGANRFDYLPLMNTIKVPILSICAQNDRFIAPVSGCKLFLESFRNTRNKLLICSISNGFKEDYSHSRIILSQNAAKEVWPLALNWIQSNPKPPESTEM